VRAEATSGSTAIPTNWGSCSNDSGAISRRQPRSHRSPASRRRLANGLVDILIRYRLIWYDRYPESHVPRLRGRSAVPGAGVFWLIPNRADVLWPRLWVTDDVLASWLMHDVPGEVVIEEIHTATELLLRTFWGRAKSASFAELVEFAREHHLLDIPEQLAQIAHDHPELGFSAPDGYTLLLDLKEVRKHAKHRGAASSTEWLERNFWDAAQALELLAGAVYEKASVRS
jgi:hypothetical protein